MDHLIVVRPRAQRELDDQAVYLAEQAGPAVGYRFLMAAEATFTLLASQPEIGWRPKVKRQKGLESLRVFTISGFEKCWCCTVRHRTEWRSFAACMGPGISGL